MSIFCVRKNRRRALVSRLHRASESDRSLCPTRSNLMLLESSDGGASVLNRAISGSDYRGVASTYYSIIVAAAAAARHLYSCTAVPINRYGSQYVVYPRVPVPYLLSGGLCLPHTHVATRARTAVTHHTRKQSRFRGAPTVLLRMSHLRPAPCCRAPS